MRLSLCNDDIARQWIVRSQCAGMVRSRRFFPRSRVKATFPHILKKKKILRICLIWLHFLPTALITDLADCKLDLFSKGSSLDRHREVSAEETLLNSN